MLHNLVIRNIRYYLKSYAVYLATVAFCAWTYTVSVSFLRNPLIKEIMGNSRTYQVLFLMAAGLLLIFTGIFVLYSTTWFFEKREREIGMYLLMGIRKSHVCFLLVIENSVLGMMASAVGFAAGLLTAPLLQMPILGSEDVCILSPADSVVMLACFWVIFILSALYNARLVGKSQLIELFKAEQKEEEPLSLSTWRAAVSLAVLIAGYVSIFSVKGAANIYLLPVGFGMVMLGTYLVTQQGTGFVTKHLRTSALCAKSLPARVSVTGILYRIRRYTGSWASVSLLIAISMSSVTAACSIYENGTLAVEHAASAEEKASALVYLNLTAAMAFLLILVCAAFVAATASMLYFKVLSELYGGQKNYEALYELGAGRSTLRSILRRQITLMFLVPYLIGAFHTMMFTCYIIRNNVLGSAVPVVISIAGYAAIYIIYCALAVRNGNTLLAAIQRSNVQ